MALLLAAILAAIPLLITPNLHFFYDVAPKAAFLLLGAAVSCGFAASTKLEFTSVTSSRYGRWMLLLLALACACAITSTVFSVRPTLSVAGTNWRKFGLPERVALLCLTLTTLAWLAGRPDRVRLLMRVAALCGLAAAAYGILQYLGWDPWLPRLAYEAGEGTARIVRPPSTLGHANYFAAWLLFPVFWGVALVRIPQPAVWRMLGAISCAAGSAAIVLSGSRSAIAGLAAGWAILLIQRGRKHPLSALAALAVAAIALSAFYVSPQGEMLRRRVRWVKEDPLGGARLWLWRDSLRMAAAKPLTGFGLETYSSAFPQYQSAELSRAYPAFYHESPHNAFLDLLTEEGLPGLAVFCALAVLAIAAGYRKAHDIAVSLLAFLICQQFNAWTIPAALYCYVAIAMLVAHATPAKAESRAGLRWPLRAAFAALAVLLAAAGIRIWTADVMLERTRTLLAAGKVQQAAAQYERARSWGASADLWYSRSAVSADAALRATATAEDRANAWYNLAAFEAAANNAAGTEHSLREAIRAAPNWFKPHWMLARFLFITGRRAEALREAEAAAFLDANKDAEVTQTLDQIRSAQ